MYSYARGLKEQSEQNLVYTFRSGKDYAYNTCEKLNGLLLDMLSRTGQLKKAGWIIRNSLYLKIILRI